MLIESIKCLTRTCVHNLSTGLETRCIRKYCSNSRVYTVVRGQGRQKNNSKNKNQNFEEIIFSKKSFFAW
jgi:gentisate 1,2-dioxygenase